MIAGFSPRNERRGHPMRDNTAGHEFQISAFSFQISGLTAREF